MLRIISTFLFLIGMITDSYSQIISTNSSYSIQTQYNNNIQNDDIFIICNQLGELNITPFGNAPFTFNWFQYNSTLNNWSQFITQTGNSSTISNLNSGGYRVIVTDNLGNIIFCDVAWVWNIQLDVSASNTLIDCQTTSLSATNQFSGQNFTYYNPPPSGSFINQNTGIRVCFNANHTYVSDIGYVLIGPPGCGSPSITLSPNPQVISNANGCCCNAGNNINNLCFDTQNNNQLNVCTSNTPITGTFGIYNGNFPGTGGNNYPQGGLSQFYGCDATEGGWSVQIYDCIGADVGSLTRATIQFTNLSSICSSQNSILYDSGIINSAINDNSCTPSTASIYTVPLSQNTQVSYNLSLQNLFNWTSDPQSNIDSEQSLNTISSDIENNTIFTFTSTITFNGNIICQLSDVTQFNPISINIGPILHD
jgi:hypothetical protein